jgi:hypothetical protein
MKNQRPRALVFLAGRVIRCSNSLTGRGQSGEFAGCRFRQPARRWLVAFALGPVAERLADPLSARPVPAAGGHLDGRGHIDMPCEIRVPPLGTRAAGEAVAGVPGVGRGAALLGIPPLAAVPAGGLVEAPAAD